jgi:hypothetical protein
MEIIMETPDWYRGLEPKFKIGQKVYYVSHDDNCPAAQNRRWSESNIRSIKVEIASTNEEELAACTGYSLNAILADNLNSYELYETQEEVEKAVEWFSVVDITDEQWMQLIGDRDLTYPEDYRERFKLERKLEKLQKPWYNFIEAESIEIEESEIGVCCAGISEARDLLQKCCRQGGLIYRDVKSLCLKLANTGHGDMLDPTSTTCFLRSN